MNEPQSEAPNTTLPPELQALKDKVAFKLNPPDMEVLRGNKESGQQGILESFLLKASGTARVEGEGPRTEEAMQFFQEHAPEFPQPLVEVMLNDTNEETVGVYVDLVRLMTGLAPKKIDGSEVDIQSFREAENGPRHALETQFIVAEGHYGDAYMATQQILGIYGPMEKAFTSGILGDRLEKGYLDFAMVASGLEQPCFTKQSTQPASTA